MKWLKFGIVMAMLHSVFGSSSSQVCQTRLANAQNMIKAPPPVVAASSDSNDALVYINRARTLHQVPVLLWNRTLASAAQSQVELCNPNNMTSPFASAICQDQTAWETCVGLWYGESLDYNFDTPQLDASTRDFVNMIWDSATDVGCGSNTCPTFGFYGICLFGPLHTGIPTLDSLVQNVPPV